MRASVRSRRACGAATASLPAGAMLVVEHAGQREAGLFGLGQGADIALAQLRQQREENLAGDDGVGHRRMAGIDGHAKPARQMLERVAAEMRLGDLRQQPGIERARRRPSEPGAVAFALEHGEIEAERVPDQDRAGNRGRDIRPGSGKVWRRRHGLIVDGMDARRHQRDRLARIHQPAQRRRPVELAGRQRHRADLDDARLARVKPGRLGVDDKGIERDQRRCIADHCHSPPGHNLNPPQCGCVRTSTSAGTFARRTNTSCTLHKFDFR